MCVCAKPRSCGRASGDDIVIAAEVVAQSYSSALSRSGVSISYQKSLISTSGSIEFAKRFHVWRLSKDVSNFSIKNLLN